MTRQKLSGSSIAKQPASSRFAREVQRVTHELQKVKRGSLPQTDSFVEQLKQCPEAFKAGEMIGKMLDSLKYSQGHAPAGDRYLPPAGAVIPPLA